MNTKPVHYERDAHSLARRPFAHSGIKAFVVMKYLNLAMNLMAPTEHVENLIFLYIFLGFKKFLNATRQIMDPTETRKQTPIVSHSGALMAEGTKKLWGAQQLLISTPSGASSSGIAMFRLSTE